MRTFFSIGLFLMAILAKAQEPELVIPTGHAEAVRTARFSPDGKYVLTGGRDRVVNIWERESGKKIRKLEGFANDINYLYFSPRGNYLVIGTDSTASVWTFPQLRKIRSFEEVKQIEFTADEKYFFVYQHNAKLVQYRYGQEKAIREYPIEMDEDDYLYRSFPLHAFSLSENNKYLATISEKLRVYDLASGRRIIERSMGDEEVHGCFFSSSNDHVIYITGSGFFKIPLSGSFAPKLMWGAKINSTAISKNKRFLLADAYETSTFREGAVLWDLKTEKPLFNSDTIYSVTDTLARYDEEGNIVGLAFGKAAFSFPQSIFLYGMVNINDSGTMIQGLNYIWNVARPELSFRKDNELHRSDMTADGRYLLVQNRKGIVSLVDIPKRKIINHYGSDIYSYSKFVIDSTGTKMVVAGNDHGAWIFDLNTGRKTQELPHENDIVSLQLNPGKTRVLTNSVDMVARVWDIASGKLLQSLHGKEQPYFVYFDSDGGLREVQPTIDTVEVADPEDPTKITGTRIVRGPELITIVEQMARVEKRSSKFSVLEGEDGNNRIVDRQGNTVISYPSEFFWSSFSSNDSLVVLFSRWKDSILVADLHRKTFAFQGRIQIKPEMWGYPGVEYAAFSPDQKFLVLGEEKENLHLLSTSSYKEIAVLKGGKFDFTDDGSRLISLYHGGFRVYDLPGKRLLYSYLSLDATNYIVLDEDKRYDGPAEARKELYFSCGMEIVDLNQVKDKLWVPHLAERIMHGDSIYTPGIRELNICGVTPRIEGEKETGSGWEYRILPGSGGLGDVIVSINGVEVKRYSRPDLTPLASGYTLKLDSAELRSYYASSSENVVTVRALTSDNTLSSRGLEKKDSLRQSTTVPPNFYAIMVGISDYKGDAIDLKYAAKDARDMARVVSAAAGKLLNTDGKQHVFVYELTTNSDRYRTPEKIAIKKTIEEIGRKCSANDVLMIFFAGHGTLEKKQFYFLTANASSGESTELMDAGISTSELIEWISPANVKAQKRILIFDACNSGQVINDFVRVGNDSQGYVAARNEDRGQQVKQIEQLNERAGFTILSASASDQSAYELGNYSQGILTYALLRSIKESPDILTQGQFLDVARWFYAAGNFVEELIRKNAARQQPQFISNTSFVVGKIDADVLAVIKLPVEKPIFGGSIVVNLNGNRDDLRLSRMLNAELSSISSNPEGNLVYIPDHESKDSYLINGTYTIKGSSISIELVFTRGEEVIATKKFEGKKDELDLILTEFRRYLDSFIK